MEVIEQFTLGKLGDSELCEDRIVLTDDYAAILDGATDKSGRRYDGVSGGVFASRTVAKEIEQLPSDLTAYQAVIQLSEALASAVERECGTLPADMPSTQLGIFSRARHEIWRVGDCFFLDGGFANAPAKVIDSIASRARRAMIESYLIEGAISREDLSKQDLGREFILPLLKRQYLFANLDSDSPFAFGVINGHPVPERFIEVRKVTGSEVVLATDGYPQVPGTLAEAEALLSEALLADPLCVDELTGTKGVAKGQLSFDDRAYLRLAV